MQMIPILVKNRITTTAAAAKPELSLGHKLNLTENPIGGNIKCHAARMFALKLSITACRALAFAAVLHHYKGKK